MKKVKIILSVITVMAMVGGALAFKARRFSAQYCVRPTTVTAKMGMGALVMSSCTSSLVGQPTLNAFSGIYYYYTTTTNIFLCTINTKLCRVNSTIFTIEE